MFNRESNYTKVTETHHKKIVNPEAEDDIVERETDRIFTGQIQNILYLVTEMIDEKLAVGQAIEKAKTDSLVSWEENGQQLTIDASLEYSQALRNLSECTRRLPTIKDNITKSNARANKFNINGEQVQYNYQVDVKTEVDFNKDIIKTKTQKLIEKADKISSAIDKAMVADVIDFNQKYSIYDSVEDIISEYEKNLPISE